MKALWKLSHKLTHQVLHPGNGEQNLNLVLGIFNEETIAASKTYFPQRRMLPVFQVLFTAGGKFHILMRNKIQILWEV